jgi:peptide/nickel transport system permease protein
MPGDPLINLLGQESHYVSAEFIQELKKQYGLDKPLYLQYMYYLINLFQGNWGHSFHYAKPIFGIVCYRLQWTLLLLIPSIILGAIFGIILGSYSGWKRGGRYDASLTSVLLFFYSTPGYWLYLIMRNSVVQVSGEGFILTARAKGLKERKILFRHVLRNALLPLITVIALDFGFMFSGVLLVEIVFSWNGMGTLIYDAVLARDYPLLQGCFLIITICVLIANFIADVIYAIADPRVRHGQEG